tara:strand:+ start:4211 stop:6274 length:2064 start_codon:yes stop_codon:yes gene_type:complete
MKILNILKKTFETLRLDQLLKLGRIGKYGSFSILFIIGTLLSVFMFKNYIGTDNTVVTDTEQIITMQKGDLVSDVTITGQIRFSEKDDLKFLSPGKIAKIFVEENEFVSSGSVLAELDDIKLTELAKNVAKAKSDVATAKYALKVSESNLRDAKESLNTSKEGDSVLIANKEKAISDAKISISKAEFDLSFYLKSGKQVDLDNAKSSYDVAVFTKNNASKSLDIIKSQWDTNIIPFEDDISINKEVYFKELNKWFGLEDSEQFLKKHTDILNEWNMDLHEIFSESTVKRDIYLRPIDNKNTQLDELTIYGWLHLSPSTIGKENSSADIWIDCKNTAVLPTTTIGNSSINKICIDKSLTDKWEDYEKAIKKYNEKILEKNKAIDTAQSTYTNKLSLYRTAKQTYEEILSRSQTDKEKQLNDQLLVNKESLKKLEDELKDLKNPSKLDISILELNVTKFQEIVNLRESELKNTEALFKNAENILRGAKIYAPYDGVVTAINKNEGDTITSTQNIISIANPNTLEFNGDVDEVDILYLSSGLAAKIQTDALRDTELDGTLKSIGSSSNSSGGVTTFSAKIDVNIPNDAALKDGLSATARVITKAKYGINLIPIQSLYGTFDSPTVKVIVNGQITEKTIEIGDSDSNWVEVISGMNETDMIVMEVPDIPTTDIRGGPPSAEPRSNNSRQKR